MLMLNLGLCGGSLGCNGGLFLGIGLGGSGQSYSIVSSDNESVSCRSSGIYCFQPSLYLDFGIISIKLFGMIIH